MILLTPRDVQMKSFSAIFITKPLLCYKEQLKITTITTDLTCVEVYISKFLLEKVLVSLKVSNSSHHLTLRFSTRWE